VIVKRAGIDGSGYNCVVIAVPAAIASIHVARV